MMIHTGEGRREGKRRGYKEDLREEAGVVGFEICPLKWPILRCS